MTETTAHTELELKAVVGDAADLRRHLRAAGAEPRFVGMMEDRRFDRDGELRTRDEVLRVRTFRSDAGDRRCEIAWKGPTRRSPGGYKERQELQWTVTDGRAPPAALFEALGYTVAEAIDRRVEVYRLGAATLRLEWYPRMDLLLEVEGPPTDIEEAIAATGLPRAGFVADALPEFVVRYQQRTGEAAVLALAALQGAPPGWGGP